MSNILWPVAIFFWVAYVNRFPPGYVYVSGDFAQPINIENVFKNLFYTWGNGISAPAEGGFFSWFAASPYYFVFYLVPHKLGLSETTALSWVLFLFMLLSYFSFLTALRLFFRDKLVIFTRVFALIYPINLTTLYFFTYTWGFSHQVFLYITLPLLGAIFYRYVLFPSPNKLLAFLVVLFLSISGFTNVAFFAALCFFLVLFLLSQLVTKTLIPTRKLIFWLAILGALSLVVTGGWLGPLYLSLRGQLSSLTNGMFNLAAWLSTQSADVLSILIGLPGYKGFFPFSHGRWVYYFSAFIPILALLMLLIATRKNPLTSRKRLSLSLIVIGVMFMLLIKKSQEPFGAATILLFSAIPLLSVFRSYEKLALFMPFLTLVGTYGLIPEKWLSDKRLSLVVIVTLFAASPFLTGGIQTNYSITLGDDPTKDYTNAKYSGLVKIPTDYYQIAKLLNADKQDSKVQDLPYSVLNSAAWVNYVKWKLIGFNVTQNLLEKATIGQNASQYNLLDWFPALELNRTNLTPGWYIKMLAVFNVSHVVYHKDVDERFIFEAWPKIKALVEEGYLKTLYDGQYATLYKINDKYRLPHFYVPTQTLAIANDISAFPHVLTALDANQPTNYLFNEVDSASVDATGARSVVLVGENSSLGSLADSYWSPSWLWPPTTVSKSLIDPMLTDIINTAAKMQAWDAYDNVLLQADLSSALSGLKVAVEAELAMQQTPAEQNKLLERVFKYLLMTNANFGSSNKTLNFFLPAINSFDSWIVAKRNTGCLNRCYRLEVPETGLYELLLENPDNSISWAMLRFNSSEVVKNKSYLVDPYINFGSFTFTKNQPINLDLELTSTPTLLLSNLVWEEARLQGKSGISRKLTSLEANQKYQLVLNYTGKPTKLFFVVTEDTLAISEVKDPAKETILLYDAVDIKKGVNQYFFTSNSVAGTGKVSVYAADDGSIDPKSIIELDVKKVLSPKIVLRKVSAPQVSIETTPEIKVKKINPAKYRVLVRKATAPYSLVLSESFHNQWKVYLGPDSYELAEKKWEAAGINLINSITEVSGRTEIAHAAHYVANGYANFWVIRPEDVGDVNSYELIVEYKPQAYFYLGTAISLVVFASLSIVVGVSYLRRRRSSSDQRKN